jgi:hypothetical protein
LTQDPFSFAQCRPVGRRLAFSAAVEIRPAARLTELWESLNGGSSTLLI